MKIGKIKKVSELPRRAENKIYIPSGSLSSEGRTFAEKMIKLKAGFYMEVFRDHRDISSLRTFCLIYLRRFLPKEAYKNVKTRIIYNKDGAIKSVAFYKEA